MLASTCEGQMYFSKRDPAFLVALHFHPLIISIGISHRSESSVIFSRSCRPPSAPIRSAIYPPAKVLAHVLQHSRPSFAALPCNDNIPSLAIKHRALHGRSNSRMVTDHAGHSCRLKSTPHNSLRRHRVKWSMKTGSCTARYTTRPNETGVGDWGVLRSHPDR
jgi:hypothetical protein